MSNLRVRHFGSANLLLSAGSAAMLLAGCSGSGSTPAPPTSPQTVTVSVSGNTTTRLGLATQFTAAVTGTTNNAVTWLVNGVTGGNAGVGTITTSGLYVAPSALPTGASVTIQAGSVASPATLGSLTENLLNPLPVVASATATQTGNTQTFTVDVLGSGFVPTSVIQTGGAANTTNYISASELKATVVVSGSTTLAIAVVTPDPGGSVSNIVSVPASVPVTVAVAGNMSTRLGATTQFTATVAGLSDTSVTWLVNGSVGGTAATGTISTTGLYTAPLALPGTPSVTIQAASVASPANTGSLTESLQNPIATLNSATATEVGATLNYVIDAVGTGFVPSSAIQIGGTAQTTTYVSATELKATVPVSSSTTLAVTVANPAPGSNTSSAVAVLVTTPVTVVVSGSATTRLGSATQFSALVTGASSTAVTWAVNGVSGGNATLGMISATGLYTAPATLPAPATVTIQATSVSSPGSAGALSESLLNPVPVITSASATQVGTSPAFTLDVLGTGFVPTSTIQVGSVSQATTYVSATELKTGSISSSASSVAVTVLNPNPGSSTSNTLTTLVPSVSATVDLTTVGTAIPQHFVGFSMDSTVVDTYVGAGSVANPILVNLLTNFSPYDGIPSLRPAAAPATSGSSNISAKLVVALSALETATKAPMIVTIGSGDYNSTYAGNVASSVVAALGTGNGLTFELGNEPDQLVRQGDRPANWTFTDYLPEFQGYETAVSASLAGRNAAGMASGGTTWDTNNIAAFLSAEASTLNVVTAHEYPLTICTTTDGVTVAHLLSDNIATAFYRRYQPLVAAATPYGLPVRAGEMNSVSCGGLAGVSDTFGASLWLLDSMFILQSTGAAGMNLHTGSASSSVPDQAYNAFYINGSQVKIRPVYYGMMMFAKAFRSGAGSVPVTFTANGSQNIKLWGTYDSSRQAHITVIEKDIDTNTQTVSINLGAKATAVGQLESLITTSTSGTSATSQVFLGGQTFDGTTDGLPVGTAKTTAVTPVNGVYTFTVPDGSAATLTVQF